MPHDIFMGNSILNIVIPLGVKCKVSFSTGFKILFLVNILKVETEFAQEFKASGNSEPFLQNCFCRLLFAVFCKMVRAL